jgi:hypothetical protein
MKIKWDCRLDHPIKIENSIPELFINLLSGKDLSDIIHASN